jgi:hypothetical protein
MRRFLASCSVVLVAITLLGACGSSSKGTAASDTNGNNSSTAGSSGTDISKLYGDAATQKFKITFTDESGDETTYAQDGNGKSVYTSGDTQYFTTSDQTVRCTKDSNGKAECSSYPGGVASLGFLGIYNTGKSFVQALGKYGDTSSKTIAGRDAKCVVFSKDTVSKAGVAAAAVASLIKGSLTYCLDKDTGVLLEASTKDADGKTTNSFTVTKFEEPSDSDFTPPATPSSISIPSYSIPTITYPPGYTGPTIPGNG